MYAWVVPIRSLGAFSILSLFRKLAQELKIALAEWLSSPKPTMCTLCLHHYLQLDSLVFHMIECLS
jgi:hypothetical protein